MSRKRSIVERLLSGEEYDLTRIDDEIDAWHEADTTISLHEWLGLTSDEYQLYVVARCEDDANGVRLFHTIGR